MNKNEILISYDALDKKTLTVEFVKDCGHRKAGEILEAPFEAGRQYIAAGFAEAYYGSEYDEAKEV